MTENPPKASSAGFDCIEIAAFIYQKLQEYKLTSPLRVQKFLWYTQIRYYALEEELLFNDEFESWMYGPVLPKVWANKPYETATSEKSASLKSHSKFSVLEKIVDHVFRKKINLFFFDLIDETHAQAPYKKGLKEPNDKIKNQWIKDFAKAINENYLE